VPERRQAKQVLALTRIQTTADQTPVDQAQNKRLRSPAALQLPQPAGA